QRVSSHSANSARSAVSAFFSGRRRTTRASSPPVSATGGPARAQPSKGRRHAESQTGKQAPRAAQEDPGPRQGILPHQEQAVPVRQGVHRAGGQLRLRGPAAQEAGL